jgi:hypothetical protein
MDDMEKANVQRTLLDLLNITAVSLITQLAIIPLADASKKGDDGDWWLQSLAYVAVRAEFEFRSMYSMFELYNIAQNPSAAVSLIENISVLLKLMDPTSYLGSEKSPFDAIKRGPYEGLPMVLRSLIKATPAKNIIEMSDPKLKRIFLETQLMW